MSGTNKEALLEKYQNPENQKSQIIKGEGRIILFATTL
jgi:hypothetical protein